MSRNKRGRRWFAESILVVDPAEEEGAPLEFRCTVRFRTRSAMYKGDNCIRIQFAEREHVR